jgi:class 3 adenylate cyclase/tetratricopeptide (TPR) repeat protein
VAVCPACRFENPEGAKFCSDCGAPLAAPAEGRQERKVVTVLFADLVGFTSRAETMDPEDVQALLSEYHGHLRADLERLGGTVEKFIGDAVMAVFGAPAAHEDDPERAVRSALVIRDWAQEQDGLQVRIGVNTGEALVSLGARPVEGEGMVAGDVVNTAARLQAAAPADGILVGETTYRATANVIDYREAEPVQAKGKTEPLRAWEPVAARARFGADVGHRAELVGRERELHLLAETLARVREERSAQLVTVIGVPGIGKSRLVYELFRDVERGNELTYWRQGRALPYGDGVTFWPMAEIAKAHTGILDTDTADEAAEKLRRALSEVLEEDVDWVARHLRPLVGLGAETELAGDRRGEAFAAWRRLFEALAERRPLVLVFEDLQWADDGMLDFVDHLVEWAGGVPLLVLCTARPELLDRRPTWGAGKLNSAIVSLSPISDADTARLVHTLVERSVLPAEVQEALLERAGGNPLYAEEFARLLAEQADGVALPGTVQGIIAARLDLLPPEEKALLQDAAVMGKVFWAGALGRAGVEQDLHALERKDFVARARRSSVAGETEYVFRHILVRDVAYGQIPRAQRSEKHRLATEWIESLGRPEDHAELLAHHYLAALDLAQAAGQPIEGLAERARIALREAGDRALGLNASGAAARFYERALEHWPEDAERPALLLRYGEALQKAGEPADEALAEARDRLLAAGDREGAAEADVLLSLVEWHRGHRDAAFDHLARAAERVSDVPASKAKGAVLAHLARTRAIAGWNEDAIRFGREALAIAEELGLDELRANALNSIGLARVNGGDMTGIEDLEGAVEIALAANSPEAARGLNNLAVFASRVGDVERRRRLVEELLRVGERLGAEVQLRHARGWLPSADMLEGRWEEALAGAEAVIREAEAGKPMYGDAASRRVRARIRLARGDPEGAVRDARRTLDRSREIKDPQSLAPSLATFAGVALATGDREAAERAVEEVLEIMASNPLGVELTGIAIVLFDLGRSDDLRPLLDRASASRLVDGAKLLVAGDLVAAADVYADMHCVSDEADVRLRAAEALVAEGRRAEADEQLRRALAFYRSVGATAYIRRAESLLAASA